MKTSVLLFCIQFVVLFAFAQDDKGKYTSENIAASSVPEAVKTSQANYYQGIKVDQWKKNTLLTKKGETFTRFVAWFKHNNLQLARAEYEENGTGKYGIVYYGAKGLPEVIAKAATALQPDFKLMSGQYVKILSSGKEGYHVTLRKGTQKFEAWLDTQGKELSKEYVAEAYKDLWGIEQ